MHLLLAARVLLYYFPFPPLHPLLRYRPFLFHLITMVLIIDLERGGDGDLGRG